MKRSIYIVTILLIIGLSGCIGTKIYLGGDKREIADDTPIGRAIDPTSIPAGGTWGSIRTILNTNLSNINGTLDSVEVTLAEYGDSITNYSADIQLRLLKSDTASMLGNYTRNGELNSALAAKVNVSDTATMLGNYTRNGELASALTAKVSVSDTASMLAHYALTSELGDAGTSIGDVRDEIADSLNALRPLYVAVADTAAMLDTYAKLTDLSEGGIGIGAVQDEIADSLNVLRPLVVMVADTASMLTNYALLSEVGTGDVGIGDVRDEIADSLNVLRPLYVAVADTASMLTNYLLASEFAVLETRTDSIVDVLADTANLETVLQVDLDTDTLATKAYARSVIDSLILNGGSLRLTGDDRLTFETNGNASYSLPAGGGNLTIQSQVQGWINDSLDVFRPLYVEVADTASMLANYALLSEISEVSIDSLNLNGGSLTLTGDDKLTFETNGNASYSLPAGGGNLMLQSAIQDMISDSLDAVRADVRLLADTIPIFVFGLGSGVAADTAVFKDNAIAGVFYNSGSDTLKITSLMGVLAEGSGTETIAVQVSWHATFKSGSATNLNSSALTVNSITTGTSDTSFANDKIPPGVFVWCTLSGTSAGNKPSLLILTMSGYRIPKY